MRHTVFWPILAILDLEVDEFHYHLGNAHIYDDHFEPLTEQIREPLPFPTITIKSKYKNIEDYKVEDFVINDYKCHEQIKMQMRK